MIRTRIAPSPTGKDVHVGSISTGLMNYAWAKKNGGQFIIRIEDTDQSRLVPGGEKKMLETLNLIGLVADESPLVGGPYAPYRQSERLTLYKKYAEELITRGKAYYCTCSPERLSDMRKEQQTKHISPKYDRHCYMKQEEVRGQIDAGASHVVRLLMPKQQITFHDLIRGDVTIDSATLDDQVLLKSDGFPTYHLGVVVDDHLMKISHIIRGEEWLPSTPKHIILYEAFGWEAPQFAHVSLLRNPDKSKLSKRKNPVWTSEYLEKGILPEALLNYLALMGWSHPEEKEIFTLEEYVRVFDLKDVQTTAPVFDPVKLEWMNGMYIRSMKPEELAEKIATYNKGLFPIGLIRQTVPLVQERIKTFADYDPLCRFFIERPTSFDLDLASHKDLIEKMHRVLADLSQWSAIEIGNRLSELAISTSTKPSQFFQVLRVAVTGKKISPPLNDSMVILGKEEVLKRLSTITQASQNNIDHIPFK